MIDFLYFLAGTIAELTAMACVVFPIAYFGMRA